MVVVRQIYMNENQLLHVFKSHLQSTEVNIIETPVT